ncbi:MAG: hypothetical protein ACI8RD_003213 [Bacillariaceae sp.]|jgi:hypothetical protein
MAYRQYVIQVVEKCKLNVDNVVESKKEEKEKKDIRGAHFPRCISSNKNKPIEERYFAID